MSTPLREQIKNDAFTTLNGTINNSTTSVVVTDGSVFPANGNFRIRVGDEIMLVTSRATNTLTVVRGYEGTTAAGASNGVNVTHVLTAGGVNRLLQDNLPLFGWSSQPPLGVLVDTNGSTLLTSSDFTWVNQSTSTVTDENGTIIMRIPPASGENCRIQKRSAPSPTYSVIAAFQACCIRDSNTNFGIGFRESSTGKFTVVSFNVGSSEGPNCVAVWGFASPTGGVTSYLGRQNMLIAGSPTIWFKITDNNTNLIYYISVDGVNWLQVLSHSRTTQMAGGPNEVLWYVNSPGGNTFENLARLVHWSYL